MECSVKFYACYSFTQVGNKWRVLHSSRSFTGQVSPDAFCQGGEVLEGRLDIVEKTHWQ